MRKYKSLFEISQHRNYKNIDKIKHASQCNSMSNFLAEKYIKNDGIYWIAMDEECYNDFLIEQNKLYEGLITTYPIDITISKLNDNYFDAHEEEVKNGIKMIVVYYVDKEDENILLNITNRCGYFLKEKVKSFNGKDDNCYDYYFTPKFAYECTDEAYSGDMCLYHLTNDYYIDKILKNGLSPRAKNKIERHPDRIYVTKQNKMSNGFIKHMLSFMKNYLNKPIKYLYILKIDLSKCEDKRFFWDPSAQNGMFTYENIPPHCISIIQEIDTKNLTL